MGYVRALERALAILAQFSPERPRLGLSELSRTLRLSKATILRLLRTLESHGMVRQRLEDRSFTLGPGAIRLGALALRHTGLLEVSRPHVSRLRALTGETVCLFMVSGNDRICVDVVPSQHDLRMTLDVGTMRPLHAGAAGKVLLAAMPPRDAERILLRGQLSRLTPGTVTNPAVLLRQLQQIRRDGFATTHDEAVEGAAAVAAPVFDRDETLVAAVNVLGPRLRMTDQVIREIVPAVKAAAQAISRELGSQQDGRREVEAVPEVERRP